MRARGAAALGCWLLMSVAHASDDLMLVLPCCSWRRTFTFTATPSDAGRTYEVVVPPALPCLLHHLLDAQGQAQASVLVVPAHSRQSAWGGYRPARMQGLEYEGAKLTTLSSPNTSSPAPSSPTACDAARLPAGVLLRHQRRRHRDREADKRALYHDICANHLSHLPRGYLYFAIPAPQAARALESS